MSIVVASRGFAVLAALAIGSVYGCTSHSSPDTAKPVGCPTTREGPSRGLTLVPGTATATIDADKVVSVFVKSADLGAPSVTNGTALLAGPTGPHQTPLGRQYLFEPNNRAGTATIVAKSRSNGTDAQLVVHVVCP